MGIGRHLGLGAYPLLRVMFLAVSLLQRVTFSKRRKGNPKGLAPAYGTSLRLSVPSLRCPSGGIAYGLLRCTSSRCVWLRQTALRAYPRMNTFARPAEGAKNQKPKPKQIKRSQPSAAQGMGTPARAWSVVRPPSLASQLPQGVEYNRQKQVGCQAAFGSKPPPTV